MTINNAINLFEGLIISTNNKSEIKIYEKFIHALNTLKNKEFSKDEIQSIEDKLDILNLESNPKNSKKCFKKALIEFEKYLKDAFSLTSKGYYTNLGIGLGSCFGMLFGIIFMSSFERSLGISLGWFGGMLIGLTIGKNMDTQAEKEGRVFSS